MDQAMYSTAQLVERISEKIGGGRFPIHENYKCDTCHLQPLEPECIDCRAVWVHLVGQMEYTDDFERRLNQYIGTACLFFGLSMGILNANVEMWEVGGAVGGVTTFISSIIPDLFALPSFLRAYCDLFLLAICAVSLFSIFPPLLLTTYIMCANPTSERHGRHFTKRTMVATFGLVVGYIVFLAMGSGAAEVGCVIGPVLTGVYGLVLPFCMRGDEDEGEETGRWWVKGEGDEKLV